MIVADVDSTTATALPLTLAASAHWLTFKSYIVTFFPVTTKIFQNCKLNIFLPNNKGLQTIQTGSNMRLSCVMSPNNVSI